MRALDYRNVHQGKGLLFGSLTLRRGGNRVETLAQLVKQIAYRLVDLVLPPLLGGDHLEGRGVVLDVAGRPPDQLRKDGVGRRHLPLVELEAATEINHITQPRRWLVGEPFRQRHHRPTACGPARISSSGADA